MRDIHFFLVGRRNVLNQKLVLHIYLARFFLGNCFLPIVRLEIAIRRQFHFSFLVRFELPALQTEFGDSKAGTRLLLDLELLRSQPLPVYKNPEAARIPNFSVRRLLFRCYQSGSNKSESNEKDFCLSHCFASATPESRIWSIAAVTSSTVLFMVLTRYVASRYAGCRSSYSAAKRL